MDCPICSLENPENARRCQCGYDFTTGAISVRRRYPVLRLAGGLARLAGWLVLLAGVALFSVYVINRMGYKIVPPAGLPEAFDLPQRLANANWQPLSFSLKILGSGLLIIFAGELLGMLVSIEHHARLASRRLGVYYHPTQH